MLMYEVNWIFSNSNHKTKPIKFLRRERRSYSSTDKQGCVTVAQKVMTIGPCVSPRFLCSSFSADRSCAVDRPALSPLMKTTADRIPGHYSVLCLVVPGYLP